MSVQLDIVLEDLITSDLGPGKRIGARLFWTCPFHDDGTPSLTVMPDGRRFICFGCGEIGDAIDWVKERRKVSFVDAVSILNGHLDMPATTRPGSIAKPKPAIQPSRPDEMWATRATSVVDECAELIWSHTGRDAITWLEDRGLTRETVARWKVGYNHRDQVISGLFVRRGILIPWIDESSVRAIKIRQPILKPKYTSVSGSRPAGLYLSQSIVPGRPTLVVEGEFDALLGRQEIGDLINVVTLGSAADRPDSLALRQLITSPLILLCYDNDPAGESGLERWSGLSARTRRVTIPIEKDITDFAMRGGDLRMWIEELLCQFGWKSSVRTQDFKEELTC